MKNIVIYSNCHGKIIKNMFELHPYTKNKFSISYFTNYENLHNTNLSRYHKALLENCDIFIYQPFNKSYDYSEYDIKNISKILKKNIIVLRINYYRFKGFWYNCNYIPYLKMDNGYNFHPKRSENGFGDGIYNSFKNFSNIQDKNSIINEINNIEINKDNFIKYFNTELENLKMIDNNSDVNLYDFFLSNYKEKLLFHDAFHPTNLFFYEIFIQIVNKICNYKLDNEDDDFLNRLNKLDMTHWATPILPIIKTYLNLNLPDKIGVFHLQSHPKTLYLDVYDYYYIRLSSENFRNYLKLQ